MATLLAPTALALVGGLGRAAVPPRPLGLRGERMPRLVASSALSFLGLIGLTVVVGGVAGPHVPQFLDAAGSLAPVAWVRTGLQAGDGASAAYGVLLAALSLLAVSVQYVASATFSRRRLGDLLDAVFVTTGRAERVVRGFWSVAAGVVEELLFRMLVPTLLVLLGASPGVAVVVSFLVFVAGHAGQKAIGLVNAAAVGAALTAVYLATGDLRWAIALHATANGFAAGAVPEVRKAMLRRLARRGMQAGSPVVG